MFAFSCMYTQDGDNAVTVLLNACTAANEEAVVKRLRSLFRKGGSEMFKTTMGG